jgi:hypothetical protein
MAQGLPYLDLRCGRKPALTSDLVGRGNGSAHAITHHGFDFRVKGGAPGAQALAGSRFRQAEVALNYVQGVAPHADEQDGRVAKDNGPKRRY